MKHVLAAVIATIAAFVGAFASWGVMPEKVELEQPMPEAWLWSGATFTVVRYASPITAPQPARATDGRVVVNDEIFDEATASFSIGDAPTKAWDGVVIDPRTLLSFNRDTPPYTTSLVIPLASCAHDDCDWSAPYAKTPPGSAPGPRAPDNDHRNVGAHLDDGRIVLAGGALDEILVAAPGAEAFSVVDVRPPLGNVVAIAPAGARIFAVTSSAGYRASFVDVATGASTDGPPVPSAMQQTSSLDAVLVDRGLLFTAGTKEWGYRDDLVKENERSAAVLLACVVAAVIAIVLRWRAALIGVIVGVAAAGFVFAVFTGIH